MKSKIMVVTTTWWPLGARLAVALGALGAHLGAICPRGSPLTKVSCVRDLFRYSALTPKHSLAAALQVMRPDLIIACDERAVEHLHDLHASEIIDDELRRLIVRSLGDPTGYATALSRGASLELATQEGIPVPASRVLRSEADVQAWCTTQTWPALLKADGSWGGAGVTLVNSPTTAVAAFRRMSRPLATWRVAKFLLSNRDPFPLGAWLCRERRPIIGQSFILGQMATTMAACWEGEVLAATSVTALDTATQFGSATIIQPITHPTLAFATVRLVRRLGLSGFCGLDFLIEHGSGTAYLIELNPRATQLGHLPLEAGGTLADAMLHRLRGEAAPRVTFSQITRGTVALFPQAWLSRSALSLLPGAYHDVPWEDPTLVAELLRRPWELRSPLARLTDVVFRRIDPARLLAASFGQLRDPSPDTFSSMDLGPEKERPTEFIEDMDHTVPASSRYP
jgi:hypothetical protein